MRELYFSLQCHLQDAEGDQLHTVAIYVYFCWVFVLPPIQQWFWSCKGAGEEKLSLCHSLYQAAHLWTEISGFCKNAILPVWANKRANELKTNKFTLSIRRGLLFYYYTFLPSQELVRRSSNCSLGGFLVESFHSVERLFLGSYL